MTEPTPDPTVRPRLVLDDVDLVPEQTSDDVDDGWSAGAPAPGDNAATLRRYLDEKPPHHGD